MKKTIIAILVFYFIITIKYGALAFTNSNGIYIDYGKNITIIEDSSFQIASISSLEILPTNHKVLLITGDNQALLMKFKDSSLVLDYKLPVLPVGIDFLVHDLNNKYFDFLANPKYRFIYDNQWLDENSQQVNPEFINEQFKIKYYNGTLLNDSIIYLNGLIFGILADTTGSFLIQDNIKKYITPIARVYPVSTNFLFNINSKNIKIIANPFDVPYITGDALAINNGNIICSTLRTQTLSDRKFDSSYTISQFNSDMKFVKNLNYLPKELQNPNLFFNLVKPNATSVSNKIFASYFFIPKIYNINDDKEFSIKGFENANQDLFIKTNVKSKIKLDTLLDNLDFSFQKLYTTKTGNILAIFRDRKNSKLVYHEYDVMGNFIKENNIVSLNPKTGLSPFYNISDDSFYVVYEKDEKWMISIIKR